MRSSQDFPEHKYCRGHAYGFLSSHIYTDISDCPNFPKKFPLIGFSYQDLRGLLHESDIIFCPKYLQVFSFALQCFQSISTAFPPGISSDLGETDLTALNLSFKKLQGRSEYTNTIISE